MLHSIVSSTGKTSTECSYTLCASQVLLTELLGVDNAAQSDWLSGLSSEDRLPRASRLLPHIQRLH